MTMTMTKHFTTSILLALAFSTGCDDSKAKGAAEGAEKAESAEKSDGGEAKPAASGSTLERLEGEIEKGSPFDAALAKVEKEMGESPLQQGEFWNFGEYDASGACVHMVLVRGGDKVQQVQFTKHQPGSTGFGWCDEMKIEKK